MLVRCAHSLLPVPRFRAWSSDVTQDVFLYAVIVPVLPFSLVDRASIDEGRSRDPGYYTVY